ncbi:MAG: hypothetical protein ACLT3H_00770 [Roseburia sp.]
MSRNKIETVLIYIAVAVVWLLAGWFVLNFPSWFIVHAFAPEITGRDIAENPHMDYAGYRAGEDIPRLLSMEEYREGIYTGLDFVTVETAEIIPLDAYRLKDPADIHSTDQYLRRGRSFSGRPLEQYTERPRRRDYLYGRYYILGLSDGSYVIAYGDRAYGAAALLGKKITFPIGRLGIANSQEKKMLFEIGEQYPVDTEKILYMINDRKVSDWNFFDLLTRFAAFGLVVIVSVLILLVKFRRKRG